MLRAGVGLALTLVLIVVDASPQPAGDGLSAPDAKTQLMRIHEAASQRNYQGTLVLSAGGAMTSSRLAHYVDGAHRFERIDSLDGEARRVLRHDDVVQTVWPSSRVVVVEQRDMPKAFPSLLHGGGDRLMEYYEMRAVGPDRVAGHQAQVFWLRPRDHLRFGQRLWAERHSGLLLRLDVVGPQDEVLESASFSELTIDVRPQPQSVLAPMRKLDGYRVLQSRSVQTQLEHEGWTLAAPVPGFVPVSCVRRGLGAPGGDAQVVQAIFSDGLTHVSVFIEPYDAQRHLRELRTVIGATHTLMRRRDDMWITVMGDVPGHTLKMFAQALERRR